MTSDDCMDISQIWVYETIKHIKFIEYQIDHVNTFNLECLRGLYAK